MRANKQSKYRYRKLCSSGKALYKMLNSSQKEIVNHHLKTSCRTEKEYNDLVAMIQGIIELQRSGTFDA